MDGWLNGWMGKCLVDEEKATNICFGWKIILQFSLIFFCVAASIDGGSVWTPLTLITGCHLFSIVAI